MILVLGSVNLDFLTSVARLPEVGETVQGIALEIFPGGKGANQALACARAGAAVRFAGCIGSDPHGEAAIRNLRRASVDLSHLRVVATATGVASIFVDAEGQNMIAAVPGANAAVDAAQVETAMASLHPGDTLLVQLELPAPLVATALTRARDLGVRTILNVAPFGAEAPALAALADTVVMNEVEMRGLAAARAAAPVALDVVLETLKASPAQVLVLTQGKDGAVVSGPSGPITRPAMKVAAIDTVGAGDSFVGFFAAGLDSGLPLETALERAVVAGSLACLMRGAQEGIPTAQHVEAMLGPQKR